MNIFNFKNKRKLTSTTAEVNEVTDQDRVLSFAFHVNSLPEDYRDKKVIISNWEKHNGDLVKKGDLLFELEIKGPYGFYKTASVHADFDGLLEIIKKASTDLVNTEYLSDGEQTFKIYREPFDEKLFELKNRRFQNVPLVTINEFTGSKEIKWEKVAGQERTRYSDSGLYDCIKVYSNDPDHLPLFFTFHNSENKDYIKFRYPTKDYKLSIESIVSFLFEDNEISQFDILNKPYKYLNKSGLGDIFEVGVQLTLEELISLKTKGLKSWKIEFSQNERRIIGIIDSPLTQFSINKLLSDYCEIIQAELTNYKPLQNKLSENLESNSYVCYVYLMIDLTNNYHKIGISNNPRVREKTLQSEKPVIELLASKRFPNRKIANSFEQALHQAYSDKRIRGEWFDLTEKEIEDIKEAFQ
jgi:hypothetical protein